MTKLTDRQKQIIQASLDLVANKGIQGLTIKNISKKVGISEPAIYRHFESKTDILLSIISTIKESSDIELSSLLDEEQTTINKIRAVFTVRAHRFSINPSLAAVIFSEVIFEDNSQLSDAIRTTMEDYQMKMIKIILQGQSKGDIVNIIDAEELALMIIGSFRLLVTKWHMSKNSFDLEVHTEKLINAFEKLI